MQEIAGTAALLRTQIRFVLLWRPFRRHGRKLSELTVAVAVSGCGLGDIPGLADAGVTELVVLGSPPAEPVAAAVWVDELARRWGLGPGRGLTDALAG